MKTLQHVSHVQLQSASACTVNLLACRRRLRSNSLSHVYLYQPVLYSVAVAFACVFCLLLFGLNVLRSRSVPSHRKTARALLQGYGLSGTTPSRFRVILFGASLTLARGLTFPCVGRAHRALRPRALAWPPASSLGLVRGTVATRCRSPLLHCSARGSL